jgi:hypothetical protein
MMGAAGLGKITGKKTKSYSPWDMFNWQFGGLTVGVLQDLSGTMYDLMQAVIGDKASQNQVLSRLAKDTTGLVREYIPFYQQGIYLLETALGKEYIDTAFIRQVISQIDKDYTPAELENIERGWYEKFQHALFGGRESVQTTTSVVEKGASDIADWEKKLGKLDDKGELYSLQSFATDVRKVERDLPSGIISEEFGFTDLALFYVDCEDYIQREYYDKYNDVDKTKWRRLAREQNPNLDAILYLWGNVDTITTTQARDIVDMFYNYYSIPVGARWTK